jgi:diacylglycerol kinase family enzyme
MGQISRRRQAGTNRAGPPVAAHGAALCSRHAAAPDQMTSLRFRQLTVTADREQPWELDGEVMGGTRRLMIVTQPGRLLVRVPGQAAG